MSFVKRLRIRPHLRLLLINIIIVNIVEIGLAERSVVSGEHVFPCLVVAGKLASQLVVNEWLAEIRLLSYEEGVGICYYLCVILVTYIEVADLLEEVVVEVFRVPIPYGRGVL